MCLLQSSFYFASRTPISLQNAIIIDQLNSNQFDSIFHIACHISVEISFEDPLYDLQTNAQSTLLLLKYAVKTKCKKFI